MKVFKIALLASTLLLPAFSAEAQNALQAEIDQLREEVQILQRQAYREKQDGIAPASAQSVAVRMGEFDETLRQAVGKIDELEFKINKLNERLDVMNKDIDIRFKMYEGKPIEGGGLGQTQAEAPKFAAPVAEGAPASIVGGAISKGDDLAPVKTKSVQQIYDEGIAAVKISDFEVAEQRFNDILKKAPDDKLAGNAQYWLGEVFYGQKNYQKAAVAFAKVIEKYKDGSKGPDSLLKLGMSMQNLKKNTEACQAFNSMKTEFPKADKAILDRAASEAKKLGCK